MVLAVPVPVQESPGNYITGALWNAQIFNGLTYLLNPPVFAGYASGAQAVATSTFTPLLLDTETQDSYGGHSTTTNTSRYVAQVAGLYLAWASTAWASNATGQRALLIAKNGTAVLNSEVLILPSTSANGLGGVALSFVQCAANDYIEAWVWQNSGGTLSTNSSGNWQPGLNVCWLHA